VPLDELASVFQLSVHDETLSAITVSYKGKTIVLTPDQSLASVSGRMISLPLPPARSGRRWLVPVEFISRALAPIYDSKLDLRKPSHLLVIGDLRVPRVVVRYDTTVVPARVVVDTTPRTITTVAQDNERLTVRFDADALDIAPNSVQAPPPGGIIQAIRFVDPVTLAIDLGPRFGAFRSASQPSESSTRLVIDFVAQAEPAAPTPAAPGPPAAAPAAPAAPSPVPAPPPDLSSLGSPVPTLRTLVIDPGHGGDDEGVKGPGGAKEKDLTLAVARRVRAAIEARLGIRVLLTRDDDRNVALDDRTATANNNKADVFLTLHANASLRKGTAGATIYYAAFDDRAVDTARAALVSEQLPSFGGGLRDIELVPWDLAQIRHVEQSTALAKILQEQFKDRIPVSATGVDRAPLRLLEPAAMPAVSIEMGFLSNPDQEKQMNGNDFQAAFAQAVVESLVRFRDFLDESRKSTTAGGGQP